MLDLLTDAELARMGDRAYREAVRCLREVMDNSDPSIDDMLVSAAQSADTFWSDITDEMDRRLMARAAAAEAL